MDETTQTSTPENKGGMNIVIVVVAIAIVLIGGYMLLNKPATTVAPTTDSTSTTQDDTLPTTTEQVVGDVVEIEMEAGSFYYSPAEIRVKKGQTVRINLASKDMMHDFNIDALSVKGPIVRAGESTVIEFVASESGSFEYYCSVGQHRQNGQVGTLIVEE